MKNVVVTGCQGFIGFHVARKLLEMEYDVIGIDISYTGMSNWSDDNEKTIKRIKNERLKILRNFPNFQFYQTTIGASILESFRGPLSFIHLAARSNVTLSAIKPVHYELENVFNFAKMLYNIKDIEIENFVIASSASVYGDAKTIPTPETEILKPLNVYANTKVYNEMMAKMYGKLYNIPFTILRFFNVYGTYGRTDSAIYKWTSGIYNNKPIILNNNGEMWRDFTPVQNIVDDIILSLKKSQKYKIYNLGNGKSVKIADTVKLIEQYIGKKAIIENKPYPEGEIFKSLSDTTLAKKELGFKPKISFEDGIKEYVEWYEGYFN